jgi:hypothetical protein
LWMAVGDFFCVGSRRWSFPDLSPGISEMVMAFPNESPGDILRVV